MKVTSLVMAIIGAVFGIVMGLIAMAAGGIGNALEEGSGNGVVGLGVSAIVACVFAMLCSGFHFAGKRQGLMTIGLWVALVWHVVSISFFAIPGGIFLLLAAIFAIFGRDPKPAPRPVAVAELTPETVVAAVVPPAE